MPLPLAHSAAGLAGFLTIRESNKGSLSKEELGFSLLCMLMANLPDFDFIPGILTGHPHRFHHGPAHSVLFALFATAAFYPLASRLFQEIPKKVILGSLLVSVLSHSALDFLSMERLPLFWPFHTPRFFTFPVPLFGYVHSGGTDLLSFAVSLMNPLTVKELVIESLFSGLVLCAILTWKERSKPIIAGPSSILFIIFTLLYYAFQINPYVPYL